MAALFGNCLLSTKTIVYSSLRYVCRVRHSNTNYAKPRCLIEHKRFFSDDNKDKLHPDVEDILKSLELSDEPYKEGRKPTMLDMYDKESEFRDAVDKDSEEKKQSRKDLDAQNEAIAKMRRDKDAYAFRREYDTDKDKDKFSSCENAPIASSTPKSLLEKYTVFSDSRSVIMDIHEEEQLQRELEEFDNLRLSGVIDDAALEQQPPSWKFQVKKPDESQFSAYNLERGVEGVFDVHDLVQVLNEEKADDICVIKVPSRFRYADYLVIANGKSHRHLKALAQFVRRLYKKKRYETDPLPSVEGLTGKTWMVFDMGNIVLHLFEPATRSVYDLETLWTVGDMYDSEYNKAEDPLVQAIHNFTSFLKDFSPRTEKSNPSEPNVTPV